MQLHILIPEEILTTKPETVTLIENWGEVSILTGGIGEREVIVGEHIALEGEPEDTKNWLSQHQKKTWVGLGTPMMQHFELMTLKD